jgi:hypothetical protein
LRLASYASGMEVRRQGLDSLAFAAALAALIVTTLWFVADRNGAAVVMCGLCLTGIVGGRIAGISGVTLLGVALGLAFILWLVWTNPPGGPLRTSALAHGAGGALAGWAFAVTLRRRLPWPAWGIVALAAVGSLTVVWELGEWLGDRALDTALIPSKRDSAFDVFFGFLGGAGAIALIGLLMPHPRTREGRSGG